MLDHDECIDVKEYLWRNQSDLTSLPATMCAFAVVYTLIITFGVLGNAFVVLSVLQNKSLQSVRNIFIVSLSITDIVILIVSGSITPITAFMKVWLFGEFLCNLVPLIQGASLCFSTMTLTAIAIDRYILIIHPTRRSIQRTHALKMIAMNIVVATAISIPMFVKQKLIKYGHFCGQFCTEDWGSREAGRSTYGTIVFVVQFIAPLLVITFCYTRISIRITKKARWERRFEVCSPQRRAALQRRRRTNRILMAMVGVFLCCWMPSVAFNFLRDYRWLPAFVSKQGYLYGIITHCISMSSTVCNPCLYAVLNQQFRSAYLDIFNICNCSKKHCCKSKESYSSRYRSQNQLSNYEPPELRNSRTNREKCVKASSEV